MKEKSTLDHTSAILVADLKGSEPVNRFRSCLDAYKISEKNPVTRKGLTDLRASASGAFSIDFIPQLKDAAHTRDIIVVDLRAEKHGILNGQPISWYAPNNHSEDHQFQTHKQVVETLNTSSPVKVTQIKSKAGGLIHTHEEQIITPQSVLTEEEMVTLHGIAYINIPVRDHHTPDDSAVETFVNLFKTKSTNTWLHMHCRAGKGRATSFMVMLDIMQNAHQLSFDDILRRQYLLGKKNLLAFGGKGTYKHDLMSGRIEFLKTFYAYAKDTKGLGHQTWSQWKSKRL